MAAMRQDVARRLSAFEFASRASDVVFGSVYSLPRIPRPSLRDREDPLQLYDNNQFLARYRFSKETVIELLSMLPLEASRDNRGQPLSPMLQLLLALRFYANGTFQVVTGDLIKVSQPTVCRAVNKVTGLIARHLFRALVHFPENAEEFTKVMLEFYKVGGFPGVTGCIDCTHVRINSPGGDNAEVFRNRKGVFSINVQAVTGPNLEFYDLVASWPGSVHDSRIFDNSRVRPKYETKRVPGLLLGDMGYACRPFLLTPLPEGSFRPNTPEARYQKAHIKTRNTVERAFGVWKRRFFCLDMRLQHKPGQAARIITACGALHNLACLKNEPELDEGGARPPSPEPQTSAGTRPLHLPPIAARDTREGMQARDLVIEQSFKK